jgi:hypothetical protein
MKRKQRIIPIIKPLSNSTLDFVSTIGNLYLQNGEHKNIAEKKIQFFLDQLRTKYWLSSTAMDEAFVNRLSRKSGRDEQETRDLVNTINAIRLSETISSAQLMDLNKKIEGFQV